MPPRRKASAATQVKREESSDEQQAPTSRSKSTRTARASSSINKQQSARSKATAATKGRKNIAESEAEEEVEEEQGDHDEEEAVEKEENEEEEEEAPVSSKSRASATRRSTNSSSTRTTKPTSKTTTRLRKGKSSDTSIEEDEAEEEEDVKPVIAKGRSARARGAKKVVEPVVDTDQENEAESNQVAPYGEEGDEDAEEEEVVAKTTRKGRSVVAKAPAKNGKSKAKRQVIEDDEDEEETGDVETEAIMLEEAAEVDEDLAEETQKPVVDKQGQVIEEEPEEQTQRPPSSQPSSTPAPPPVPTAYDLAAQARLAALNHAALEKEREKEREGKPRLVIHQLVLEDFKSYRGRGVIGPFHKSFSSIVGPNGSGKSNTIDALLFVFGYRATKMRQGKLSELIHNSGVVNPEESSSNPLAPTQDQADGAEFDEDEDSDDGGKKKCKKGKGKKKDATYAAAQESLIGSCTVEVWFREIIDLPGRDDFTVVPNSQLIVARTAYRNNSSRYTINGKLSNFTEVTTLLKARGIDLDHKRFLILQGEVESIAQMKPKGATEHDEGLLEYLEDIIGTSKYKEEIETANVEVERLNDARGIQLNRVKLVEREKGALESRKKECDSYLRDQNELVHNQSALFQVNIHQASYNAQIHAAELEEATATLEAEIEDQKETREEAEAYQKDHEIMLKDYKDTEKATTEITKHLAVLDRADVQRQEKKKSMVTKVKKLKKSLEEDTHARSEADTWVKNHSETIARVGSEMEKMEAILETEELELEQVRDSLKGKTEVFSSQIEVLQKELQPWAEQIAEKQAAIDLAQNERDLLMEKSESAKVAIEEAEEMIAKLRGDDSAKRERLAELATEKKVIEKQIDEAHGRIQAMQGQDTKLRSKASAARQKADEVKASQSASRSQGNLLATLTKLKDQGRLPGFHGRLGDLGRIDDQYDVAISTACPGLDNLITDTIGVAQQCIEVLRKNNLGRANLMALEKVQARNMAKIPTPENAARLFDLITPKEDRFAPCFYQLLQNTLVADNLEQGKRLAFPPNGKRWRVVTLDGQLIDTSGTMSGGGNRPIRGKMSSKIVDDEVTPEVVARCEKERETASEALRAFTEDRVQVEKDLINLRKRLPEIDMAISKIELDLKTSDKRVAEATTRLKELRAQSKPEAGDLKKIAQLEKEVSSLTKELEHLRSETSGIEVKITALQNKILEVGGVRLRGQQTKVQDLKAQIDHANERLTKAEVGKVKSEKDAVKLSNSIANNKKSLEAAQSELDDLLQHMQGGDDEVQAVRDAVEKAQAVLEVKRDELAEMKRSLDSQVEIMTQFRKREMELKQKVDQNQKLLKEANNAIEYWSEKVAHLVLNEIGDDDEDDEENAAEGDGEKADGERRVRERTPKVDNELHQYSDEEIAELDVKVLKAKISALEERIAKSTLDLSVLKEYARREKEFMQRAADLEAVTKERDAAKQLADELRGQRLREFMIGFGIISMKLKEMYQMITLGGNAELELVDSLDPFSEGIIFSVMPPKKSWKNISNLSGGEKTLSSLALVFALHVFKPTPLYFMDEIDAALDFRNVSIVANYIKDRTKNAQFIIISLRNNMFELSSRLIGIYKVANQTRSVAIDNKDLAQVQMVAAPA